ncbi:MAG: hypothetical protein H7210_04205 [Pyrinomonadaceae bacterium]|nr:hypothetical protein [Phycisphaerales bacterium]
MRAFLLAASSILTLCGSAQAWELRARFVERVGNVDIVLPDNRIEASNGRPRRIRLQFGVFDDAHGVAPVGGLFGMIDVSYTSTEFTANRTPGRLPAFASPPGANGEPATDPFVTLTNIDAVVGSQSIIWSCAGGAPTPQPAAIVRGRNTFVSVYEITVDPDFQCTVPRFTLSGGVVAVGDWSLSGSPVAPICIDPPSPGSVTYIAETLPPVPFSLELRAFKGHGRCIADWNHDHLFNSNDFFAYLTDFFAGNGDTDCNGTSDSADFFWFLDQFLSVCQ